MTNWNDGTIHGWNGGDCPVHPETVVEFWMRDRLGGARVAGGCFWGHDDVASDIIAFRVVKEYVEPKVIWVNEYYLGNTCYTTEADAKLHATNATRIAVKYVEAIADAKECKE